MRPVHELLRAQNDFRIVIAFIQHGTEEQGYEYENVCPYCASSVGERILSDGDMEGLLPKLQAQMSEHMPLCVAGGFQLRVFKTNKPLGTDKPLIVM